MSVRAWITTLVALTAAPVGAVAQESADEAYPEARVWLDRGSDPLLQRGDRVRVYYRTSEDAYVAIFHIDTDGSVRLLHPRAPGDEHYVRGGRDYRLLFPQSSYWFVDEFPGKGYFFMVASPTPFDFSSLRYTHYDDGWDLSAVGRSVYEDPYVAMDEYIARLIPDWETAPYGLDFLSYDVGEQHEYPRFLCYDCHGFRTYTAWNPYTYACASFRVVIWDDPYFYPRYRYNATRVVFTQPRRGVPRFGFKERAAGEAWSPLTRTRQAAVRRPPTYVEPSTARARGRSATPESPTAPGRASGRPITQPGSVTGGRSARPRPSAAVTPPARRTDGNGAATRPPTGRSARPATGSDGARGGAVPILPPDSQRGATRRSTDEAGESARPDRARGAEPATGEKPEATKARPTQRPVLRKRPSRPPTKKKGEGGGTSGVVLPSRPNAAGSATEASTGSTRPSTTRSARPPTSPTARPTARPTTGQSGRAVPGSSSSRGSTARPRARVSRPQSRATAKPPARVAPKSTSRPRTVKKRPPPKKKRGGN